MIPIDDSVLNHKKFRVLTFLIFISLTGCPGDFRVDKQNTSQEGSKTDPKVIEAQLIPTYNSIHKFIFEPKCIACHSPNGKASDIPLVTYEDFIQSPREIVIPGDPDSSGLYLVITGQLTLMPPRNKLSDKEISTIKEWITRKAPVD